MVKRDNRPVGLTRNAGWQIGVRRTFQMSYVEAWRLITSPDAVRIWLGAGPDVNLSEGATYKLLDGTSGEVRVFSPNSHLRITWHPEGWPRSSTIQIRVIPKDDRTIISFHQEHLPGPKEREERRAFFASVLDELQELFKKIV